MRGILFFLLAMMGVGAGTVQAQVPGGLPTTCDPAFNEVLETRAWLEGQREIEAAETFILKPDSVLEYSCFNQRVIELANASKTMFSDNVSGDLFKNETFRPNDDYQPTFNSGDGPLGDRNWPSVGDGGNIGESTGQSLGRTVQAPLGAYLSANFGHPLAGGAYNGPGGDPCGAMQAVWNFIRCGEFNKATFKTLQDWAAADMRTLPAACNSPVRAQNFQTALAIVNPPAAIPPAQGGMEAVRSYFDLLSPASCDTGIPPIPTGLKVMGQGNTGALFDDKVCSAPGCWYDPAANVCRR